MKSRAWTLRGPSTRFVPDPRVSTALAVTWTRRRLMEEAFMKKSIGFALVIIALTLLATSAAQADCITGGKKAGHSPLESLMHPGVLGYNAGSADGSDTSSASIVGLWTVTFMVGNTQSVWDQGFEQWHSDGTEITIDVAVPPAAGNVCLGVWERVGLRGVKLHHVGWNWDTSANPAALAGVFVLDMTVTLSPNGNGFRGSYVSDSYDNAGKVIPAFHADGVVTGQRITVH